ncbi:MAG: hypothetical protein M1822_000106 [Bathelium mastoideum]|nr:MAG: hypothetical protein M1822_000106 [Bathelium mastoideum]
MDQEYVKPDLEHAGAFIVNREKSSSDSLANSARALKTTPDGRETLIPQPSEDPADPLNWSWGKKHSVLLALGAGCLLTDWGMTWGSTLFEAQAMDWHMTPPAVSNSITGGIFLQGPGGILAVPLIQRYGRLPVLFWSQLLGCIVVIGAASAPTYAGFTACRVLQGFVTTAPQVIGLTMIHDMFFFHERARKVNLWVFSFLIGPFLGPFISGFLIQAISWRHCYAVLAGFYGASTVIISLLGDETLYDRKEPQRSTSPPGVLGRIQKLTGIAGIRAVGRPSPFTVAKHLVSLSYRPYLFLPTAVFIMINFMFLIGLTNTISLLVKPPPYLFSDTADALLYLAPMIGVIVAELFGHFFNDFLQKTYIRTHEGRFKPESRLWGVYLPWFLGVFALVVFGETYQFHKSWVGLAIGWGMQGFAVQAATTAISAYVLDCFPQHAALASSWINFWRTTGKDDSHVTATSYRKLICIQGGFCVNYFQSKWVARNGPAVAFGCQAAIVASTIFAIVACQIWGAKWRSKYTLPPPEN